MFRYNGTTIPNWACNIWKISEDFSNCTSKKDCLANVQIEFQKKKFEGWVTIALKEEKIPPIGYGGLIY